MDIQALVNAAHARRAAKGLKSTYTAADGSTFDMFHPNEATKAFWDFKHALYTVHGRDVANVPAADMAKLKRLERATRNRV